MDVPLTHGGGGKVVAARGSKQCPPRGVRGVHSGSRVGRWVREVDDVHMGSVKREGVKGKAENNARVTRQRAVPFEMFCIHLPFVTWRNLGASGEVEEVGGRAVGVFFALCCLGKIPGGAPFSQLHKSGNGSRVDRP